VLFLTGLPWDFRDARRQQLAARLARAPDVAGVLHAAPWDRRSALDAVRRRLGRSPGGRVVPGVVSTGTFPSHVADGLAAPVRPLYHAARRWLDRRHLGWRGGIDVVYISHPMHAAMLDACPASVLTVLDWTDDFSLFRSLAPGVRAALAAATDRLLERVDLVVAVSRALCDRARAAGRAVEWLPNATDLAGRCDDALAGADPLAGIPRPRLGYVGQLANRLDYALLDAVARAEPGWSLVLVGPVWSSDRASVDALARRPNVHLLGPREHAELPRILPRLDVCLLPHTVDALTDTMDPIKLYDYLAAGRPIVSTPVAGTARLGDAIAVAATPDAFIQSVRRALEKPDEGAERRRSLAASNSWDRRAEELLGHLRAAWKRKHGDAG
jgi:glycosyltransferase involved in cell wall biosynthesis